MLDAIKRQWKFSWQLLSGTWFFVHGWFALLREVVWRSLRPVLYLWPWLVADAVFIGYLTSSQGAALSSGLTGQTWMQTGTLFILVLSLTCTVGSMLFTSLVVTSHEASRLSGPKMRVQGARQIARAMSLVWLRGLAKIMSEQTGKKVTTRETVALTGLLLSALQQGSVNDELKVSAIKDAVGSTTPEADAERHIDKLADLATSALPLIGVLSHKDLEAAKEAANVAEATDRRGSGRLHVGWVLGLAFVPVLALLWFASSLIGWSLIVVFIAVVAMLTFGLKGIWADATTWMALMSRLYAWRPLLAVVVAAAAVLPLILGAAWITRDPLAPIQFGPLFTTMVGLAGLSSLAGTALVAIPYCTWHPWYVRLALLAVIALNLSFFPHADLRNPFLRDQSAQVAERLQADSECDGFSRAVGKELADRAREAVRKAKTANAAPAMRFVSADGGGIRAAYWTALGLAKMGETVEGFEPSIATLSGVSGGSLGIATWLAAVETTNDPVVRRRLVTDFLGSDFLSPAVAGMLFLDAPRLLFGILWWPTTRRDHVFEAAIVKRWAEVAGPSSDFFLRPVRRMCMRAFGPQPPLVFFNATEALLGEYVASGNTQTALPGAGRKYINELMPESTLLGSTVVEAVLLSARFPFLSAAADIGVRDRSVRRLMSGDREPPLPEPELLKELSAPDQQFLRLGVLVDGGYFDNSGITTTREMLALLDWNPREGRRNTLTDQVAAHVVHFSNDPQGSCVNPGEWQRHASDELLERAKESGFRPVCLFEAEELEALVAARPFSWLTSPVEAIFAVRRGHAAHEVKHVARLVLTRPVPGTVVNFSLSRELSDKLCAAREDPAECRRHAGLHERAQGYGPPNADARATDAGSVNCRTYDKASPLPLGWTLSEDDKELLGCLAASGALRAQKDLVAANDAALRARTSLMARK